MPEFETAEKLLLAYMESCHNTFPFLAKKAFTNEFYHYYASIGRGNPYQPAQKWQATINLVFAIGAVYSHLSSTELQGDERAHSIYYARAVALGLQDPWWLSHPDLPQMQLTGLVSFYYLVIGRINRAWMMIGLAMRCAYALGLHMRNEDPNIGFDKKEFLGRIWWAHFAFERFLSAMTGRPSQAVDRSASVPLPLPIGSGDIDGAIIESRFQNQLKMSIGIAARDPTMTDHQKHVPLSRTGPSTSTPEITNSGTYLTNIIQLCEIIQRALQLYSSSNGIRSWQDVQGTIASLNEELEVWATSLPEGLNFFKEGYHHEQRYSRERNSLDILYHNTRILINRPCLCRLDRRIVGQTTKSNHFNEHAASICVSSAQTIAHGLGNDATSHVTSIYKYGPWWNMVHAIMQSLVVLLLEFSLRPQGRLDVVSSLRKLIRWLRAMRANDGVARRAYKIAFDLLKKVASHVEMDIRDLVQEEAEADRSAFTSPLTSRNESPIFHAHPVDMNQPMTENPYASPVGMATKDKSFQVRQETTFFSEQTEMDPNEFNYSVDVFDSLGQTFPGLFYTNFDEQTPLPGFGSAMDFDTTDAMQNGA